MRKCIVTYDISEDQERVLFLEYLKSRGFLRLSDSAYAKDTPSGLEGLFIEFGFSQNLIDRISKIKGKKEIYVFYGVEAFTVADKNIFI